MTEELALADLFDAAVTVAGARVGRVAGVVLDRDAERVLGVEVSARGASKLFLPWVAARPVDGAVRADSALVLLDLGDVATYARLGARIVHDRREVAGLGIADDGTITSEPEGQLVASGARSW